MHIELDDGQVLNQEGIMAIETELGTLYVERAGDDNYPGFYISLRRPDGREFTPLLVEVDQSGYDEPTFEAHYWSPEHHFDDPVWDVSLTAEQIDSTWEGE